MEILELKSAVAKIKSALEMLLRRFEQEEENASEPEDKVIEITQSEEQKEGMKKRMHRAYQTNETSPKLINMHIMMRLSEEGSKKERERE